MWGGEYGGGRGSQSMVPSKKIRKIRSRRSTSIQAADPRVIAHREELDTIIMLRVGHMVKQRYHEKQRSFASYIP